MTCKLAHALEALYGLERRKDKLGLEGTQALLAALGNPHQRFRSVHVAGTNGKGSVCALIERALREAGYRTGLYTSPHLVDFRERIRVAGRWADETWLEARLRHIQGLRAGEDRTFFEVCTALAFDYFADRGVEIAVVEVGLGGRLDCTNVLAPEVCVITTVGLDHTEILGATTDKIAAEKAGIIKPGVPVVLPGADADALRVIEEVAREREAPLVRCRAQNVATAGGEARGLDGSARGPRGHRAASGYGVGEPGNLAQARAALRALGDRGFPVPRGAVERGLARARWPGRFERCPSEPRLWWDGAHNAQAFETLGPAWAGSHPAAGPPGAVVLALSRDKDAAAILAVLRRWFEPLRLVVTRSRNPRAMEVATLAERARRQGIAAESVPEVGAAIRHALALAAGRDVLLCGSLFAVGEAMEMLGGGPGEWL